MTDRRRALDEYLHAVVDDLVLRGIIGRGQKRPWLDLLKSEPQAVVSSVLEDLAVVGGAVFRTYLSSGAVVAGDFLKRASSHAVDGLANMAANALDEFFGRKKR